jgi:hypothetical protein
MTAILQVVARSQQPRTGGNENRFAAGSKYRPDDQRTTLSPSNPLMDKAFRPKRSRDTRQCWPFEAIRRVRSAIRAAAVHAICLFAVGNLGVKVTD